MDYSSSDVKKLHTVAMAQMREKKKIVEKLLLTDKAKEYYHRTKALEAFKTIFYEARLMLGAPKRTKHAAGGQ